MEDAEPPEWVGKEVRDIYGRRLGRAVGMIFELGGKISSVGVEDGDVLIKINPDRITSDGEELVVTPEWMLETKNAGLDRGGLMKRFSALSLMVNEKRISQRLSKDIFASLSAIQKSHEAVLARTMARLEDLARADTEIDDFVSLVTLQHVAGEMSGESFDFTVAECEKIKAINGKEILDIRRTLGMAKGEQSVADPGDGVSPESGVRDRPGEEAPPPEENASGEKVVGTSYSDTRQADMERQIHWGGNAARARIGAEANSVFGRKESASRGREGSPIQHGDPLVAPIRLERPAVRSAHVPASPYPDPSLAEPSSLSSPVTQDSAAEAREVKGESASGKVGSGKHMLGQQVSEWVFAKIADLESLDIKPGGFMSLGPFEEKRD